MPATHMKKTPLGSNWRALKGLLFSSSFSAIFCFKSETEKMSKQNILECHILFVITQSTFSILKLNYFVVFLLNLLIFLFKSDK